ncbi:MAG: YeeE/YedE thiosulfate transporter family protein [Candidatus Omnitrophica bacterium]|nr:YeeE/YedE thiosulfate transporter family protein [Candidatus Omnitrophota bacterium]
MKKIYLKHWSFLTTGPILSLLLIIFWYFNQNFLSQSKGPVALLLENPVLTFGLIIFGAFISAFISRDFSIKTPVTYEPLVFALIGGIVMGCGAVIAAMSAHSVVLFNLAGIFNLTAFLITKGWVYAACMILGGFVGAKLFSFLILRTAHSKKEFFIPKALMKEKNQKIIFITLLSLFSLFVLAIVLFSMLTTQEKIGFFSATFLLILFGIIVERGTICMSSMLKEWFIAHSAYVWRSILFTVMCLAFLYQAGLRLSLYPQIQLEQHICNIGFLMLGSFLMGFGFIFADGCFIGSLWKAGQGNVINIAGIFGMLLGIGVSQVITGVSLGAKQGSVSGLAVPNYLNTILNPIIFLVLLWIAGIVLLTIFKQKHYRY